jgi:putative peptidoglycan lipid II flippase
MLRESVAAGGFGAAGWSLFAVAFTVPNLFRKLLGEGAISSAFIPLYTQALRAEPASENRQSAGDFANTSVNLQLLILFTLTILGELALLGLWLLANRPQDILVIQLTAVMLPYVVLVCATAFLGGILQVHGRFAIVAANSIILNAVLILGVFLAARRFDLREPSGQYAGAMLLAVAVVLAGALQLAVLIPSLRAVGFRFAPKLHVLTPAVRKMLRLTAPVAISAGVLQLGVLLDKGIAYFFATGPDGGGLVPLTSLALPLVEGAAARLNWAQFMYQFPLGVFAIALATAIFPKLSEHALDTDHAAFRTVLRRGITASLFVGLPATAGMMLVAFPATNLLFRHGNFSDIDARWVASSTLVYSAGIWAFSLLQIVNRAYFALHDTRTPLIWACWNLVINLVIELPLMFTPLKETGMAVGTFVSFAVQALAMTWMISRRLGGIGLRAEARPIAVMLLATALMSAACWGVTHLPFYPTGTGKAASALQLTLLMTTGILVYATTCHLGGIDTLALLRKRRTPPPQAPQPPSA